jgi:hypothetical protein
MSQRCQSGPRSRAGPIVMPQQIEENLRDDVGFRQPGSSFRRQADEAGQSKEVNHACDGTSQSYCTKAALVFRFFEAFSDRKR